CRDAPPLATRRLHRSCDLRSEAAWGGCEPCPLARAAASRVAEVVPAWPFGASFSGQGWSPAISNHPPPWISLLSRVPPPNSVGPFPARSSPAIIQRPPRRVISWQYFADTCSSHGTLAKSASEVRDSSTP